MNYSEIASIVTDVLKDAVYVTDVDNNDIYYINEAAAELFSVNFNDTMSWKGRKCYEVIQKRSTKCEFCTNHLLCEDSYYSWEHYYSPKDMIFFIQDRLIKVGDKNLRLCVMNDITRQRRLETELRDKLSEEQALNACIEHLHTNESPKILMFNLLGIVGNYFNADNVHVFKVDYSNEHYEMMFEWYKDEKIKRSPDLHFVEFKELEGWFDCFENCDYNLTTSSKSFSETMSGIIKSLNIDSLITVPWKDLEGKIEGFIGLENPRKQIDNKLFLHSITKIVSDFIDKLELHNSLHSLSLTDAMTGLGNRYSYRLKVEQIEKQSPQTLGVVYLDINGLKQLNDEYGQAYGDKTIEKIASMLFKLFGMNAFRISGDDFIILYPDAEEDMFYRDVAQLKNDISSSGISVCIGTSYSNDDVQVHKQIGIADSMMYTEKQQMFNASQSGQKYRTALAETLIKEISQSRFFVCLQPQIELDTGNLIGAEALIRKNDKDGKIIPPINFLPFYEQQEIIHLIDFYVLETICKQFEAWDTLSPGNNIKVATNFSRITLKEDGIVEKVKSICDRHQVSPSRIVIEITESVEVFEREQLCKLILEFAEKGFAVSLDDFGSGHSNLSVLTSSNFDEVKIDKSIVDHIVDNSKSLAIAKLIVNMCHTFNIESSVAEGVEYSEQYNMLRSLNCTIGQGYFFDKPLPIMEFNDKYFKTN